MEGEEEERAECRGTDDVVGNLHQQRGQMARHDDGGAAAMWRRWFDWDE
jgi:hypothetical protein